MFVIKGAIRYGFRVTDCFDDNKVKCNWRPDENQACFGIFIIYDDVVYKHHR